MKDSKKAKIITAVVCGVLVLVVAFLTVVVYRQKNKTVTQESTTVPTTQTEPETTTQEETTAEETTTEATTKETTTKKQTTQPHTERTTVAYTPGEPTIEEKDGLTYVNGILIVNKTYSVPSSYDPGLNPEAANAFAKLVKAAKSDGISIWSISNYRPYSSQQRIYNGYVSREGKAAADRHSARPGFSEHQTGLAYDVNSLDQNFGKTKEGIWLAENCYKYGFIIRYQKDKESITGYMYEPWHIRYLGVETATAVYNTGLCLEEYLGITSQYAD